MCHVSPMESLSIDKHPSCDKSCLNNPFEMIHHRSNHAFSKTLILNAPESHRSNHSHPLSISLYLPTFSPSTRPHPAYPYPSSSHLNFPPLSLHPLSHSISFPSLFIPLRSLLLCLPRLQSTVGATSPPSTPVRRVSRR